MQSPSKVAVLGVLVLLLVIAVAALGVAVYGAADTALTVARDVCHTRNASIAVSNKRWALEREAWTTAAHARAVSAAHETGVVRASDLAAAATYRRVADAITPYPPADCK